MGGICNFWPSDPEREIHINDERTKIMIDKKIPIYEITNQFFKLLLIFIERI